MTLSEVLLMGGKDLKDAFVQQKELYDKGILIFGTIYCYIICYDAFYLFNKIKINRERISIFKAVDLYNGVFRELFQWSWDL